MIRIGAWSVDPASGQISREGETARLEVRTLRLLLYLAEHAGEVVSIDELLNHVWAGVTVSSDSVYQAVTSLRRQLGDDPRQPTYIATVPRLGYRMVAAVSTGPAALAEVSPASSSSAIAPSPAPAAGTKIPPLRSRRRLVIAVAAALSIALVVGYLLSGRRSAQNHSASAAITTQPLKSIAVLPFLDLTQGMKEEEFADGMTEELIDKLGKIPGLSVPAPTSVFYFKGKQVPLADIARQLGVIYVLDGSVRKSGDRVRIAARLVRAENGYVIWTETYDRPFKDLIMIQDDIAGEATKALRASIEGAVPEP